MEEGEGLLIMALFEKGYTPWNKGKKLSLEHRRKLSEVRKGKPGTFTGRKHTAESLRKMSEAQKKRQKGKPGTMTGRKHTAETLRKMSEALKGIEPWNKGKTLSPEHVQKVADANRGNKHTPETRRKMSETHKGKILSDEHKRNIRLGRLRSMAKKHGQLIPNYSPDGCVAIDKYGKKHGYVFQHAENGGEFYIKELGYWVDGYDAEQNVVIEYDESSHYRNGKLKGKDIQRQQEIQEHLGCKFVRITAEMT